MKRLILILLLSSGAVQAAELRSISVDKADGIYTMTSVVWFDASLQQIYATMLNWDLSTEFSSVVVESRNLEPDEQGRPQYYSRNEACVMFFCKSFERNGVVEHRPYEFIRARVYPERSDFYLSNEKWTFKTEGRGTIVTYDLEFKPKFFVPPLIGPWAIKRKMKEGSGDAIQRIEAVARRQVIDAD